MSQRGNARRAGIKVLSTTLFAVLALGAVAFAQNTWEFWPEVQVFKKTGAGSRLWFDAPLALGIDSDLSEVIVGAHIDISLRGIRGRIRKSEDWQRSRTVWSRTGYAYVTKTADGKHTEEHRGILSLWQKFHLPGDIWLEARERADLRLIDGAFSSRFRFRLEAIREFNWRHRPIVPFVNYEWFYDTRYDGWARTLLQVGTEFTMTDFFRFELVWALQTDRLPSLAVANAISVVAKWYY